MRISLHNLSNAGRFAGALLLLCCAACGPRQLPDPLTPEEHLLLGKAYEHQGDIERAAGQYATASAVVPEGDFYLGNLSAAAGQDQTALDYYRKAQPDMPDDPHLNNNLAWVLCRLGSAANDKKQLQEAEALARKAVAAAPPALLAECRDTLRQIRLALSGKAPQSGPASLAPPPGRSGARESNVLRSKRRAARYRPRNCEKQQRRSHTRARKAACRSNWTARGASGSLTSNRRKSGPEHANAPDLGAQGRRRRRRAECRGPGSALPFFGPLTGSCRVDGPKQALIGVARVVCGTGN